jgi:hypothetical protein
MPVYIPPTEYVAAATTLNHVTTSSVTTNKAALVRRPIAWVLWPVLTLTRVEVVKDPLGVVSVTGVLVDHPEIPKYRVFYATPEEVVALLRKSPRAVKLLTARKHYLDYRCVEHLLDDGWVID